MIANNCPFGRACCDGCNYLTTGGCIAKQNTSQAYSITHDGMVALWERREDAFIENVKKLLNKKDDRDCYTIGYIKRHLEEIIKEVCL